MGEEEQILACNGWWQSSFVDDRTASRHFSALCTQFPAKTQLAVFVASSWWFFSYFCSLIWIKTIRFVTLMLLSNTHPSHIAVWMWTLCVFLPLTVLLYSLMRLILSEGQGAKRLKLNFWEVHVWTHPLLKFSSQELKKPTRQTSRISLQNLKSFLWEQSGSLSKDQRTNITAAANKAFRGLSKVASGLIDIKKWKWQ